MNGTTMTKPSTDQLHAWARQNGLDVADRGRLSPKVLEAWTAAQKRDGQHTAQRPTAARGNARTAKKSAPASKPARSQAPISEPIEITTRDDEIIIDLRDQVQTLQGRVAALESAVSATPKRRFFRSRV